MQKQRGDVYTFVFATIVCIFCSVGLALAATALKPAQETNARLDIVQNILSVVGYSKADIRKQKPKETLELFRKEFRPVILNGRDELVERKDLEEALVNGLQYPRADMQKLFSFELLNLFQSKKNLLARRAGKSLKEFDPGYKLMFVYEPGGKVSAYIVPIQGNGLWDVMYGYIALEADANTVRGITFYEHKETPGLGGEVDKPWFQEQYKGKTIFKPSGEYVSITIEKGKAADKHKGEELKHYVDGISGASLTGKGVNNFLKEDLGVFVSYFKKLQTETKQPANAKQGATNSTPKTYRTTLAQAHGVSK